MADGVEVGRAHVTIEADAGPAARRVQQQFSKSMPEVGKKSGRALGAGIVGAAARFAGPVMGALGLLKGAGGLVSSASDLNETISKSDQIFGKNAKSMRDWAAGAPTAFGQTRNEALGAAASFGDMFSQIGFTNNAAADMSKTVIGMSADFGSFNNLPTADVQQRISAAFRGEYDSLQAIIPNISAARVEQVAMAESGKKNASSLTAQEKAQAVLAIMQKDGAKAAGDFARTQGGQANQQKILVAQLKEMGTRLGGVLLPVVNRFTKFLNTSAIPAVEWLADRFKALANAFRTGMTEDEGTRFETIGLILRRVAGAVKSLISSVKGEGGGLAVLGTAFRGIVAAAQGLGAVLLPIIRRIVAVFMQQWPAIRPVVVGIFTTIKATVVDAMGVIAAVIRIVTAVIRFIWSRWGTNITNIVVGLFKTLVGLIGGAMKIIGGIVKLVLAILTGDWGKARKAITQIVAGLKQIVVALFRGLATILRNTVGVLLAWIISKFVGWANSVRNTVGRWRDSLVTTVKDLSTKIRNGDLDHADAGPGPVRLRRDRDRPGMGQDQGRGKKAGQVRRRDRH